MFTINKTIYNLLINNSELTNLVPISSINTVITPQNIRMPYITFRRSGQVEYTKDLVSKVDYSLEFYIYTGTDYALGIDILQAINSILNNLQTTEIVDCRLINFDEQYAEDTIIHSLVYSLQTRQ